MPASSHSTRGALTRRTTSAPGLIASLLLLGPSLALGCGGTMDGAATAGRAPSGPTQVHLSARSLDGVPFDLAPHLDGGDVVLINFWATYCEPCLVEMPFLQQLHEGYGDRGLTLVAVSLDGPETAQAVAPLVASGGYTFRIVTDADPTAVRALNPEGIAPYTVLVDRRGRVATRIDGFALAEAGRLEAHVRRLVAAPSR